MERVIERFLEYVKIDSPSREEADFCCRLRADLEALGLEVTADDAGGPAGSNTGNLIAYMPGTGDRTIMFSAHMDTVSPGRGIKPIIEDGVIRSDGTTILGGDDKAGIAAIVEMISVLKEQNIAHHSLELVFTICEEVGLLGSKHLDCGKLRADFGVVLDSSCRPGETVLHAPAQNKLNVKFRGRAAHAGVCPENGVSAIKIAAEAIASMKLLRIDEETTANVGVIRGGTATNIVTDTVEIMAEARSLDDAKLKAQTDHMVACVREAQAKYGIEAEIEVVESYRAFRVAEDSPPAAAVRSACERAHIPFRPAKSGGGSDTNIYNQRGIPSVNIGIGMKGGHSLSEHIAIDDILAAARIIIEIAKA